MSKDPKVSFHHVHFYVDLLKDLSEYKRFEETVLSAVSCAPDEVSNFRGVPAAVATESFPSEGRDFVKQLIAGFGFRITAHRYTPTTRSVLVTSKDSKGIKFLITAITAEKTGGRDDAFHMYSSCKS